jgi:hypothetical protein
MDITTFAAPPPGSAKPGNLYADLQSRTLWLGVDPSVDPAAAVLISDIVALQTEIDGAVLEAKAYTDTQITTRAPTVHTHVAAQITDFNSAVAGVIGSIPGFNWVRGMIMMYSGSLAEIGVGELSGWALCDGSNGTPNLRDRFIMGAGNKVPGSTNPAASFNVSVAGAHVHTINGFALTTAHMPYHSHGGNTGYFSNDHSHYVSLYTSVNGSHVHYVNAPQARYGNPGGFDMPVAGVGSSAYTTAAGDHQHTVNGSSGGQSANHYHAIPAEGGGAAHTHTESFTGDHTHAITSAQLRDSMPYYALAFIMKL